MKTLSNESITIKVSEHGAELTSIVNNKTGREYLWQADPQYWKRHSPILFPIVGSLWNNEYRIGDMSYPMSQHGFARDREFELISEKDNEVFYELNSDEESLTVYPFPFKLKIGYRLIGNEIEVLWQVENTGTETLYFQIGAHPAFNYKDFDVSEDCKGYFAFDKESDLEYLIIKEKGCVESGSYIPLELNAGLLEIKRNTFDRDALIFENGQMSEVSLLDKGKHPYVTLRFDAPLVGLWSPAAKDAPFVCIEPWYGRCDRVDFAGEFKDKDWMNRLVSGEIFNTSYSIVVE